MDRTSRFETAADTATDRKREVARLDRLAGLLDDCIRVPGTEWRVGLDGLIGLIPGIGDTATAALSAYLLGRAWRLGAPIPVLVRMAGNIAVDLAVGAIPVFGDFFDFGFKANRRNVQLLRDHLARTPRGRR